MCPYYVIRCYFYEFFPYIKVRKRELAKLDENRRAEGMLNAILSIQVKTITLKATTLGGEGKTPTSTTTVCPEGRRG